MHTYLALLSALLVSLLLAASAEDAISFSYPHDDSARFLLLGDAVESHELIELTSSKDPEAMSGSAGRFLCRTPIRMVDPHTGQIASFITSFSFRMYSINSSYQGDGMAFLIVPDNYTVGSSGEQLGIFTPAHSGGPNDHTFAVEFDTWQNSDVHDPNGNHVGVDVTNVTSIAYNNASNVGIQLNDGSVATAWIKYDGTVQNLQVRISVDSMEPVEPLIDVNVSFAHMFNEYMYVGFSGSTGVSNEAHSLLAWTFSSWGLSDPSLSSSASGTANTPTAASQGKKGPTVALTICLILVLLVLVFGLLSWKMTSVRICAGESYFRRAKYYDAKLSSCVYPRPFTYRELYAATRGFSEKQKLGGGTIFKGVLVDSGSVVAVKQVAKDPREGLEAFLREVHILGSLSTHKNLVPVQGWCLEKGELLLVYEFIPNESLDKYLFDARYENLSWSQRYHIVTGLAAGLAHLHEAHAHSEGVVEKSPPNPVKTSKRQKGGGIICDAFLHRDVKASNVMLDNNFNARLGDYGLGRLVCRQRKDDANMVLEGTFGYIAPEVVATGKMSAKSDVFSFGIVLLEVVCGKRAIDDGEVLLDMVWEQERCGQILGSADTRLKGCFDVGELECLLHLSLLCTLPDPGLRPTMSLIHRILIGDCAVPKLPPPPKQWSPPALAPSAQNAGQVRASLQISIDELLSS